PTSPVKDLSTHTRAMSSIAFFKQTLVFFELTGKLSSDYPLRADEKPPQVRRRIGAAFKLDEGLIPQDREESELRALEADLALHQQIYEAVRRLSLEENLSKPVRKSRLQQCKHEERKVKELQEAVLKHHVSHGCVSPQTCCSSRQPGKSTLAFSVSIRGPLQHSPVQNSPWRESSLDEPYEKHKQAPSSSSSTSSPTGTLTELGLADIPPAPQFVFKSLAMHNNHSNSAPSTPELPLRRHISQSFSSCQHAQPTSQSTSQPSSQDSTPLRGDVGKLNPVVTSLAEPVNINKMQQPDSTKRVHKPPLPYPSLCRGPSLKEHRDHPIRLLPREVVSNDLRSWHQRYTTEDIKPRALERHGFMHVKCLPNQEPPPYHQIQPHRQVKMILQRAPDGTPLQWYEEDDCEIVSQV
uniref:Innate immunity activator a n=1 Tax=Electrophorus electricus TaxID=8005 RepID=A0A4W4EST6_ELEEL